VRGATSTPEIVTHVSPGKSNNRPDPVCTSFCYTVNNA